jgi:hypothetical protein
MDAAASRVDVGRLIETRPRYRRATRVLAMASSAVQCNGSRIERIGVRRRRRIECDVM